MTLSRLVLIHLSLLFFTTIGCKNKIPPPPVPSQKMTEILTDISIAEAYSVEIARADTTRTRKGNKNYDSLSDFYADILAKHQVDKEVFTQTMEYYKHHPDTLKAVLDAVIPALSRLEGENSGQAE